MRIKKFLLPTPYSLFLIILLAFALRSYHLDSQSLRGDEAASVIYAAMPITELWELARVTDPHPPLYYVILHGWQAIMGESAWAMRYAGVMAGTLAVAALYRLTQVTLRNTRLSLLAAFLLAINPLQIWLAQDVRSYAFFTLMGLLASWLFWLNAKDAKEGERRRKGKILPTPYFLLLYIILTVANFYTHYYAIFLMAFHGLFILIQLTKSIQSRKPPLTSHFLLLTSHLSFLISYFIIGLLILPGLQLAYHFSSEAAGGIEIIPTPEIFRQASTALLTGFTLDYSNGLMVSLILAPIWLIGLVTLLRFQPRAGQFWGLFFALPVLGVIALSIGRPFFKERFLIQAQPAFEVLLAVGFMTLWQSATSITNTSDYKALSLIIARIGRFIAVLSLLFLLAINGLSLHNYFNNPLYAKSTPWHLYHDYVADHARAGDVMLTNFPEASVSYYSPNTLPFYVVPDERDRDVAYRLARTAQIAQAYQRIWFLPLAHQGFDEESAVLTWLDRHADRVNQIFFPQYNLNLYLTPSQIEAGMISQPTHFAHNITLRGYQIWDKEGQSKLTPELTLQLKPKQKFTLSLYWQADQPTDVPYTVYVHVVAADGFNRTSQDNQPVWGSYPTHTWQPHETITDKYTLTIPEGTPPGPHQIRVGWYRSDNGARVSVTNSTAEWVVLGMKLGIRN